MPKKEEKKPQDMTTDETLEFLFGEKGARKLKEVVEEMNPPTEELEDDQEFCDESA